MGLLWAVCAFGTEAKLQETSVYKLWSLKQPTMFHVGSRESGTVSVQAKEVVKKKVEGF